MSSGSHQHHCRHSSSDPEIHSQEAPPQGGNSSTPGCSASCILQSSLDLIGWNQGTGVSPRSGTDSKERQSRKTLPKKTDTTQRHLGERRSETLPVGTGAKAGEPKVLKCSERKKDDTGQTCKGDFPSYRESSVSKKVALTSYSSASLPERSTSAFSAKEKPTQDPKNLLAGNKPQPSASTLLKLLKDPSVPRPSRIPCRNNYELHHSPITSQPPSIKKTQTYAGTHSAPTSPPNPEDTSHTDTEVSGYSSLSAPKSSKASKTQAPVHHYENVDTLQSSKTQDDTASSDKSSLKTGSTPSSESDTSSSDSSSSSSDQDSDTEDVLQRAQNHFSLPTSSSAGVQSQRISYPCIPERYHIRVTPEPSQMISGAFQVMAKGNSMQVTLPRRTDVSRNAGDLSYHSFKDRLEALGRVKNAEDLQQAVIKASASKTVDRHMDRKIYLRNTSGNYIKGPVSSSTTDKRYIAKTYSQKIKMGTLFEAPVVIRNSAKYPNPNTKTVPSPHCSPPKIQSKSLSKAASASSNPRGTKVAPNDRMNPQKHQSGSDTKPKPGLGKKKTFKDNSLPPPVPSRCGSATAQRPQEKKSSTSQSIEQRVMQGIEENVLKDRSQEAKNKGSIASWFGLKKSKLPALSRKPGRLSSSASFSGTKDSSGTTAGPKKVESLNISKLMEKAEDLRKALEDEKVYVRGVGIPLDRPTKGRSCEVMMDTTQGHLSLMYTGLTGDSFMQQLLTRYQQEKKELVCALMSFIYL